jgi:hypothetical protein
MVVKGIKVSSIPCFANNDLKALEDKYKKLQENMDQEV